MTAPAVSDTIQTLLPPGPSNAFFGLKNFDGIQHDILTFLEQLATYGDIAYARIGPRKLYLLNNPDLIHEVLISKAEKFNKWSIQKKVVGKVVGEGTFNLDGEVWKQQRKLVQPAFHAKRIQAYAEMIVEETKTFLDSWQMGREYDMLHEMLKVTMGVVAQIIFSDEVKGQENVISHALEVCLAMETAQMTALFTSPDWLPTKRKIEFRQAIKTFDELIYGYIKAQQAAGEDKGDVLSMLLLAADEEHRMTDKQVRDEALTLFSAGHETTANTLTWTLSLLAENPDVEAKMIEEIDRVLGDRPPTLQDLRRLPYVEMVLKESMRLRPPAYALVRENTEDVTIGGYNIPKNSMVMFSQHVIHRDLRYWDEPEKFMPERFGEGFEKRTPRYAYFPFGGGAHVCTGQALAMMEAQIMLTMLYQRFRFTLTPDQEITPVIVFLQRPLGGLKMTISQREQVAAPTIG